MQLLTAGNLAARVRPALLVRVPAEVGRADADGLSATAGLALESCSTVDSRL